MPDGSTGASALTVDDGVDTVTAWGFDDTPLGARAGVTLFVVNTGTTTSDALAMSIAGGDGFAIDAAGSTCSGATLAPGARCRVALAFAPTTLGPHMAQLHVTGALPPLDFPLRGTAIAAGVLAADIASLDFGQVEVQMSRQLDVLVSNPGSANLTLSPRTVTAGFSSTDNCPATLTPGGACTVHVTFTPVRNGIAIGTLTVPSSANTVIVGLRGIGARRVTVALGGAGSGRVTSTPAGIACGTTCTGLFTGPVALTASPDTGNFFTGWGLACSAQATCTLPAQGPSLQITATFQPPTAKRIDITIAGTAPGFVYVAEVDAFSPALLCTSSCTTYVAPGTDVTLYGFTPSTFAGWTGACAVTTHDCNLGTVIDDRAATVTFDRDEREVATIFPRELVTGLTMTPDGNLVVAGAIGVSKLALSGDVVWTTPIAGGAHDLASDAAGRIYGAGGPGLFALSPTGAILWTRAIAVAPNLTQSFQSTVAVSPDGTVIAAHTRDGAHVVDGSGADRFTRTGLTADGLAVAPDGTVAIGTESANVPGLLDVVRFDASGAALPTLSPLPGDEDASLVYDAQNFLCAQTTHGGFAHVSRIAPDLTTAFTSSERLDFAIDPPAGIAIDSSGEVVAVRGNAETLGIATGLFIEVRSPTGTVTWTHSKPSTPQTAIILDDGVTPAAAAADGNHHIAIGGVYNDFTPWIQVYAMP